MDDSATILGEGLEGINTTLYNLYKYDDNYIKFLDNALNRCKFATRC